MRVSAASIAAGRVNHRGVVLWCGFMIIVGLGSEAGQNSRRGNTGGGRKQVAQPGCAHADLFDKPDGAPSASMRALLTKRTLRRWTSLVNQCTASLGAGRGCPSNCRSILCHAISDSAIVTNIKDAVRKSPPRELRHGERCMDWRDGITVRGDRRSRGPARDAREKTGTTDKPKTGKFHGGNQSHRGELRRFFARLALVHPRVLLTVPRRR